MAASSGTRSSGSGTYHLGIDLGTTYVAAGILRRGRPEIVTLGDRSAVVPSVLYFKEDGEVLHGDSATRRGLTDPTRVAREFKRRVGDATPMVVGQTPYSADVLLAKLLLFAHGKVVERQGGLPGSIAVTHPANWGSYKIDVLHQAVRMAEIGSITTLTEPVAAAIHYAATERLDPGQTVAVYDLGGGTFDAAVLRRTGADTASRPGSVVGVDFEVLGEVEGIDRLGGIDFDEAVFHHTIRWCEDAVADLDPDDPGVIAALARLRQECVLAKEALSTDTDVSIPVLLPNLQTDVRLTRAEFEAMIRPLLQQTVDALHRAIRSSGVAVQDLAAILLVGGSSRIPLIAEMVGADLGRPIAVDQHPKHTVALGAAIVAGRAAGDGPPEPAPGLHQGMARPSAAAAPAVGSPAPGSPTVDQPTLIPDIQPGPKAEPVSATDGSTEAGESQMVPLSRGEGNGWRTIMNRSDLGDRATEVFGRSTDSGSGDASPSASPSPVSPPASPPVPPPGPSSSPPSPSPAVSPPSSPARPSAAPPGAGSPGVAPTEVFPVPPGGNRVADLAGTGSSSRGGSAGRGGDAGSVRPFDHRELLSDSPPRSGGGDGRSGLLIGVAVVAILAAVVIGAWTLAQGGGDDGQSVESGDDEVAASGDGEDTTSDTEPESPDVSEPPTSTESPDATEAPSSTENTTTSEAPLPASGRMAAIDNISLIDGATYAVTYSTTFEPVIGDGADDYHLHFFFDTVTIEEAGLPADPGNWILYDGPSPFQKYGTADRPEGATQLCVTVATSQHRVDDPTVFDCLPLPD